MDAKIKQLRVGGFVLQYSPESGWLRIGRYVLAWQLYETFSMRNGLQKFAKFGKWRVTFAADKRR